MSKIISSWQKFCNSVEGRSSTRQLAAGVAIGMLIGLMPKDSLLAVFAIVLLILSPANLLTAGISAIVFSFIAAVPTVNSAMHTLGMWLLGQAFFEGTIRSWWSLPLVAWTRVNNSVVMGSLLLWIALLIPVYLASASFFEKLGNRIYQLVRESSVLCWLIGSKKAKLSEG